MSDSPDQPDERRSGRFGASRGSGEERRYGSRSGGQRFGRPDRDDRGGRPERGGGPDRGGRPDRGGSDRGGRPEPRGRFERSDRPGRPDRSGRPDRPDRRGGRGRDEAGEERRGGSMLVPKRPRLPEPAIREGITGNELDRSVRTQLRTLSKENAEGVAQHLVMIGELIDSDIEAALAHAETAARRAGRVPAAREALGYVAYRMGDFSRALSEFRTARRLSGSNHVLPLMVDCERGLGRLDRALELASGPDAATLTAEDSVELAIVVSGIRRDMGQPDAAAAGLVRLARTVAASRPIAPRLYYAYAEALLATGDTDGAREWFAATADADRELETDAAERLDELDGIEILDLGPDEEEAGDD